MKKGRYEESIKKEEKNIGRKKPNKNGNTAISQNNTATNIQVNTGALKG